MIRKIGKKALVIISASSLFALIVTGFDILFAITEPFTNGWGFSTYVHYTGRSLLIDIAFLLAFNIFYLVVFYTGKKITKLKLFRDDVVEKVLSLSVASLIILLIVYPINFYFLPSVFHIISILVNAFLVISVFLLGILLYYLIFKLFKLSFRNIFLSISSIGLSLILILSPLFIRDALYEIESIEVSDVEAEYMPNIIIITIDALRADHLSCYGYDRIETPNIDRFADDSVKFSYAYSITSWTNPSMMSMLTGKYPTVHGCYDLEHSTPETILSFAQVLDAVGYENSAILANINLDYRYGFARGFDNYLVYGDIKPMKSFEQTRIYRFFKKALYYILEDTTSWATDEFKNFIKSGPDGPFFLWVHYMDPHDPYTPPEGYIPDGYEPSEETIKYLRNLYREYPDRDFIYGEEDGSSILNLYDGEILYVDDMLGEVFEMMKERGIYENSLIILSADHGEEFWEHTSRMHGKTLYKEVVHIPFLLKFPEGYKEDYEKREVSTPISLIYLPGTILDILGIEGFEGELGATNILERSGGGKEKEPIFLDTTLHRPLRKIVMGDWALIYNYESGGLELYNISSDPYEQMECSADNQAVVDELFKMMSVWMEGMEVEKQHYGDPEQVELDEETLEEMRGLGYIE